MEKEDKSTYLVDCDECTYEAEAFTFSEAKQLARIHANETGHWKVHPAS